MQWDLSGKVMIIDNVFKTVKELSIRLTKAGIPVLFWNGRGKPPASASGVRIVILDLDLIGQSDAFDGYDDTADILGKIPGPYAVLIHSVNATEDSPEKLESAYLEVMGKEIPGFIIKRSFAPKDDNKTVVEIIKEIKKALDSRPILSSILLAERILDYSKEVSLGELAQKKFDPSLRMLVKSINKGTRSGTIAREMSMTMNRLQSRHLLKSKNYRRLEQTLAHLLQQPVTAEAKDQKARIMHLRTFFQPDDDELDWTGDIYRTGLRDPAKQYAVLLTPACDISQEKKVYYFTFCFGFKITEQDLRADTLLKHVIYRIDPKTTTLTQAMKYVEHDNPSSRFYPLDNFTDESLGLDHFRVLLDMQCISCVRIDAFEKNRWRRLWRLDSPFIEDLLQKYGSYAVRIGTPPRLE